MRIRRLSLLLAAALGAAGCNSDHSAQQEPQPAADGGASADGAAPAPVRPPKDPLLVRVQPVARGVIERRLEATANVESLDVVDVMPERAEPVLAVLVEEGQVVAAGQELARLRSDQVELAVKEAEVRVKEVTSQCTQAERDHQRNLRLWEEGGASGRLIAEQAVETSRQLWDAAQTALESAEVALERARWEAARCVLRSPIAGVVSARDLSVGDMAVVGQRAFQITDLARPKVLFYRPQRELSQLSGGLPLTATSEALPGVVVRGRIERVSPVVDAATGTVKVTAALEPEGRVLPVGLLMRVEVVLERREDALLVPKEALLYETESLAVFVAREGVARRLVLAPGLEDARHVEALAGSGLSEGDALIVVGADRLADGDPVEVAAE